MVSRAPAPVETNSPLAQTPLAPLRRLPAWTPDTFSMASTIASGAGSCAPAAAMPARSDKAPPDKALSAERMRAWTMDAPLRDSITERPYHAARLPETPPKQRRSAGRLGVAAGAGPQSCRSAAMGSSRAARRAGQ